MERFHPVIFNIWIVPLLMALIELQGPTPVHSLNANVTKAVVYTNLQEEAEIFCFVPPGSISTTSETDRICKFSRTALDDPSGTPNIALNATGVSIVGHMGPGTYSYVGQGVSQGQCGLLIQNISLEQIGHWRCEFIDGQSWTAKIEVLQYEKPSQRSLMTDDFGINSEVINLINVTDHGNGSDSLKIACCTLGGKPIDRTKLSMSLDVQLLPVALTKIENWTDSGTCVEWAGQFEHKDNGKTLTCTVSHPAFIDKDDPESKTSTSVNVNYKPEIIYKDSLRSDFIDDVKYFEDKVSFTLKAFGNPRPVITIELNPEEPDENPTPVGILQTVALEDNNVHTFNVTIEAPKETMDYKVTVTNSFGKDSGLVIVSPNPGDEDSAPWTLIIVGVVVSLVFVLIILYILNYNAKKRGWLCYKGRTGKYPFQGEEVTRDLQNDEYSTVARNDDLEL